MFTDDIDWSRFFLYLKDRYSDSKKVNTYIYGCSNGSEAYSMSILYKKFFQNPDKFYPIIAKDIIKHMIKQIKSAKNYDIALPLKAQNKGALFDKRVKDLNISDEELNEYIEKTEDYIIIKKNIRKGIKFAHADIIKDIHSIDSKNPSIVMARNFWSAVDTNKYQNYADKLYKKLAPKSIVVLGYCDYIADDQSYILYPFANALEKAGFTPSKVQIGNKKFNENVIFEKN